MKNILILLLLLTAIASCKKEDTVWESDWNVPVVNDTLSLANLVNDSTLSVSSGYYTVDLKRSLFDLSVSDIVKIPDTTIEQNFTTAFTFTASPNTTFTGSVETYTLEMDDLQLKHVTLKEGYIDVHLENPVETKVFFLIKLPKVFKDGSSFLQVFEVPAATSSANGILNAVVSLAGCQLDLTGEFGGSYNELLVDYSVTTDPNGGPTLISSSDVTKAVVTFRGAKIYYAQGYFGSTEITDTTEIDLEALSIYKSGLLDINDLNLSFEVENGIKVGAIATLLSLENENAQGSLVALEGTNIGTNITVNPATGGWSSLVPSTTSLIFNSSNSNIEGYLENMGVKHRVGYTFKLNPWGNVSSGWDQVFPDSRIRVNLRAQMPLSLGMYNLVLKDTFEISLNQDEAGTRVVSGDLILDASNGFPFNANVTVHLLNSNGAVIHSIEGSELIESSQYGILDSQTGILVQPSTVNFSLTEEIVADVNNVKKIMVEAKFNSPNPQTGGSQSYLIPDKAFLGVKLKTNFKTENRF